MNIFYLHSDPIKAANVQYNKHVVKIDNYSLPEGSRLGELDNRHAGDPSSRFVDVKNGEMQRADFAICNCNESIENEISSRKQAYAETEDKSLESSLNSSFTADGIERSTGGRFDQASGTVGESDIKPLEQQLPETRDQDWGEQSQADSSDSNNSEQRQAMEEAAEELPTITESKENNNNVEMSEKDEEPFTDGINGSKNDLI